MAEKLHWAGSLADAYAHIGNPKYGTLQNAAIFFERLHIKRAVLVLGPGLPDLHSLQQARELYGEGIRFMGIPFGETEAQRRELGEIQIGMGISGMRVMPAELTANIGLLDRLGAEGLWLFAINPHESPATTQILLDWLERHPNGRIASPHFLSPVPLMGSVKDTALTKELLMHPRFFGIFSRQAGVGSTRPYPHTDLLPWVMELAETVTFERLMWGSEFPIFYQRNEQPEDVRDWLLNLGLTLTPMEQADFYYNNANRCFFSDRPRAYAGDVKVPEWVVRQMDGNATVYVFPNNPIHIPMAQYNALLTEYLQQSQTRPEFGFDQYIVEKLCKNL